MTPEPMDDLTVTKPRRIDISGMRFGKLIAVSVSGKNQKGELLWHCHCDCGKEHNARGTYLRNGTVTSCGCAKEPHGMTMTPEWRSWREMLARCGNPNNDRYGNYGGRGIKVCDRWKAFTNFYADMGKRHSGTSLDRINNDGDYSPENCRWADRYTQQQNTRRSVKCSINGVEYPSVGAASRELGIHRATLQWRFDHGVPGYVRLARMKIAKEQP